MKNLNKRIASAVAVAGVVAGGVLGGGVAYADNGDAPDEDSVKCQTLGWIGDSTSVTLLNGTGGTLTEQRQSFDVGSGDSIVDSAFADKAPSVKHITADFASARTLHERVEDTPNGVEALNSLVDDVDCVVMVMGTNDGVRVATGSKVSSADRISQALAAAQGKPVFWVTPVIAKGAKLPNFTPESAREFTASVHDAGEEVMQEGDSPLNIIDMTSETKDNWFTDGVHYNTEADQERAGIIAQRVEEYNNDSGDERTTIESGEYAG